MKKSSITFMVSIIAIAITVVTVGAVTFANKPDCKQGIVKEQRVYMKALEDGVKKQQPKYLIRCPGGTIEIESDNNFQLESTVKLQWVQQPK